MKKLFEPLDIEIKNELIKKVISVISHETQTDLLIIQARVMGLLKKYNIEDEDLAEIFSAIKRIYFFEDMSYMNFMENTEWSDMFPVKLIDVSDAISTALSEFPLTTAQKNKIIVHTEDSFNIQTNQKLFSHMIQNIVKNALFFSSATNKEKVLIATDSSNTEQNRIIISNNGPDIEETEMAEIFAPYTTTRLNGLGMGLNSAQKIAEYFSANISVAKDTECIDELNIAQEKIEKVNFIIAFNKKLN